MSSWFCVTKEKKSRPLRNASIALVYRGSLMFTFEVEFMEV